MADSASGQSCKGLQETYDAWGNRTAQSVTSGSCFTFSAAATAKNQLSGYTYDAAGNLIADGSHRYYYDADNRLIQIDGTLGTCSTATACYIYDAQGQRVQTIKGSTAIDFVRDLSGKVIADYGPCGTPPRCAWNGYMYLNGELFAQYANGTTYFVHSDHLGSTRLMTNLAQGIYDSMDYQPFGEQIAGGTGTTHKFTGKERDSESGLDMFGARYYGSSLGRFMTPDWAAKPTNVPYAQFGNPQSLNLYSYVNNNPTTTRDPDGHCLEDACVIEGAVVVTAMAVAYLSSPPGQQLLHNAVNSLTGLFHSSNNSNTAPAPQSNPAPGTQAPKDVYIDPNKYPASAGHVADAQAAGHPDVLTVDRPGASDRRADATAGHATQPGTDRDEYPPAVTREGGTGASVQNIPSSDNRGSGASLGNQISDVPNGGQIRVIPQPPPPPPPKPQPQNN